MWVADLTLLHQSKVANSIWCELIFVLIPKPIFDGKSMPQNKHSHIPGKGLNVFLLERLDLFRSRIRILFHMNWRTNCPV